MMGEWQTQGAGRGCPSAGPPCRVSPAARSWVGGAGPRAWDRPQGRALHGSPMSLGSHAAVPTRPGGDTAGAAEGPNARCPLGESPAGAQTAVLGWGPRVRTHSECPEASSASGACAQRTQRCHSCCHCPISQIRKLPRASLCRGRIWAPRQVPGAQTPGPLPGSSPLP